MLFEDDSELSRKIKRVKEHLSEFVEYYLIAQKISQKVLKYKEAFEELLMNAPNYFDIDRTISCLRPTSNILLMFIPLEVEHGEEVYNSIAIMLQNTRLENGKLIPQEYTNAEILKLSDIIEDNFFKESERIADKEMKKIVNHAFWYLLYLHRLNQPHPSISELITCYLSNYQSVEITSSIQYYEMFNKILLENGYTFQIPISKLNTEPEALPQLHSIIPDRHVIPTGRLANELQHNLINAGARDLIVAGKGTKNEVTSYVCITYEETDSIAMTGKPYTEYDRNVQNAICSLWEYGHQDHIVTSDMIFRAMTHRTQTECPSPQQIGAVTRSIEKMRRIHVEIDATPEMKKLKADINGKPITSFRYNEFLLSLREIEVKAGGKTVRAYKILGEPILLTYAKATRQFATIDATLLDIKKVDKNGKAKTVSIANTEERIAVKGYLLRRILVIRNDKINDINRQSDTILFDSLFEETEIPKGKHSARTKEYTYQVLDYWKSQGFINDYIKRESTGNGRKNIDAIIIKI